MLRVKHSFNATDAEGNEVFVAKGDKISEISDEGPVYRFPAGETEATGWNVIVRFTPIGNGWNELVTVDAVKLLKALEG